jgi:predicted ATPase
LDAVAPRDAASLIRVLPDPCAGEWSRRGKRRSLDIADAQELRRRAFASLQDLLARLAERRTLVVAIDDVQWGDLDSAAFLRALFIAAAPPSLLLIASYRAEDADTSPFLKAWRSQLETTDSFMVENVALAELTPDESEELAPASCLQPPARRLTLRAPSLASRWQSVSDRAVRRYAPRDAMDPAGLNIRGPSQ